jgi:hypothetical protein
MLLKATTEAAAATVKMGKRRFMVHIFHLGSCDQLLVSMGQRMRSIWSRLPRSRFQNSSKQPSCQKILSLSGQIVMPRQGLGTSRGCRQSATQTSDSGLTN